MEMAEYLQRTDGLFLGQYGLPLPDIYLPPLEQNVLTSPDQPQTVDSLLSVVQDCIGKFNNDQRQLFNRTICTISPGTTTENRQLFEEQFLDRETEQHSPKIHKISEDDEFELN